MLEVVSNSDIRRFKLEPDVQKDGLLIFREQASAPLVVAAAFMAYAGCW